MIRLWKGDDKLARSLVASADANIGLHELGRAHESDELEHEVGLLLEQFGCGFLHGSFELVVVCAWHAVPSLGLAKVVVVDAVRTLSLISDV